MLGNSEHQFREIERDNFARLPISHADAEEKSTKLKECSGRAGGGRGVGVSSVFVRTHFNGLFGGGLPPPPPLLPLHFVVHAGRPKKCSQNLPLLRFLVGTCSGLLGNLIW
jgi:hypothetical protein